VMRELPVTNQSVTTVANFQPSVIVFALLAILATAGVLTPSYVGSSLSRWLALSRGLAQPVVSTGFFALFLIVAFYVLEDRLLARGRHH
jgi:hypothetical protein